MYDFITKLLLNFLRAFSFASILLEPQKTRLRVTPIQVDNFQKRNTLCCPKKRRFFSGPRTHGLLGLSSWPLRKVRLTGTSFVPALSEKAGQVARPLSSLPVDCPDTNKSDQSAYTALEPRIRSDQILYRNKCDEVQNTVV